MNCKRVLCLGGCILLLCLYVGFLAGPGASERSDDTETIPEVERAVPRAAADPSLFISVWNTTETGPNSSDSNSITLPLESAGTYHFTVYWGDGASDTITAWNQTGTTHTYASGGVYTVNISGAISGWRFNNSGDRLKLVEIRQWGSLNLGDNGSYFQGCSNLALTATDDLNLTGTTSMRDAFRDCSDLGSSGDMNGWNVSDVTDMSGMFRGASSFNQPIGSWDVSGVMSTGSMFYNASSFNQPIGSWDVSGVTDMQGMFAWTISFNQPIDGWDVSGVMVMDTMFLHAISFNQPIGSWNVSSVTTMTAMFYNSIYFNQPIGSWDVSGVWSMGSMFYGASSFNQPIGIWDVSKVISMFYMFCDAISFNQPIGSWNVSSVWIMKGMLNGISLSSENYDDLLIGWSQLSLQSNVTFDAGSSQYSSAASAARQSIIDTFGWNISDGGPVSPSGSQGGEISGLPVPVLMLVVALTLICFAGPRTFRKSLNE